MSLYKIFCRMTLFLACGVFFAVASHAQFKASIQGTVMDPQGTAVPGAKVTVTASAEALHTENANVGNTVSTDEITRLPAVGRDPYELLRLTPGVFGDGARQGNGNTSALPNNSGPGGSNSSIFQVENQVQ